MNLLSLLFGSLALWLVWRLATSISNENERLRLREEDWQNWHAALKRDPRNASALAFIAERQMEDGNVDGGIQDFRAAISIMPYGPFTAAWKRKLKSALELEEQIAAARAAGRRVPKYGDWRVCPECDAKVLVSAARCPGCRANIRQGFLEWCMQGNNQREVLRTAIPLVLVLWGAALFFSTAPAEVKGVVIILSAVVGAYFFIRSFDKQT